MEMGFVPRRMEPDVWMRACGDDCEYVATHVDDLMIASKDPKKIIDTLMARSTSVVTTLVMKMEFYACP